MLRINDIDSGYNGKQILFGISMEFPDAKITAIIGPNGSGKSTILKTIFGIIPLWRGEIYYRNELINGSNPIINTRRKISFFPQGNRVFNELTVKENLALGGYLLPRKEIFQGIEYAINIFPELKERFNDKAENLSNGEQQMLSFARSIVTMPKVLLLDEPSMGLSQKLVEKVFNKILEINQAKGTTIIIVEQKVDRVLAISDCVYAISLGKVIYKGKSQELINQKEAIRSLFS